ncbi:MAG: 3-phosphoshikimate 1-carboxyvinyltransferase [Thermomicrobiales bacterium]
MVEDVQRVRGARRLRGTIRVPGDKSISHRALLFNALATGTAHVRGFLDGADCRTTLAALCAMGVQIEESGGTLTVQGAGIHGLTEPADILDCGNSGTTTRLLLGILAGQPFFTALTGDGSLRRRPMARVTDPLRHMGARIDGRADGTLLPLGVRGGNLHGIAYALPIASAQVKSSLLLAALFADGPTTLAGRTDSRDHTERMLRAMGADLVEADGVLTLTPGAPLTARDVDVPGDISSAAFWLVAGAAHPDAELTIEHVGVNPTRTGILDMLALMGAEIDVRNAREVSGEPVADLTVRSSRLRGAAIGGSLIPRGIDELVVLAVAAAMAAGRTVVRDAAELRVKESDRVATVVEGLRRFGARAEAADDGFVIEGPNVLLAEAQESHDDHRLAMAWAVAALIAHDREETAIHGASAADVSYPTFWQTVAQIAEQ